MPKVSSKIHCGNRVYKYRYHGSWILKRTTRSMRQGVNNLAYKQKTLKSILKKKPRPIHPPKDCATRKPEYIQKLHQQGVLAAVYANAEDVKTVFPNDVDDLLELAL